ncbi:MAG: MotA/TolQ/ExbB proton channel family protein [Bdellovibrionales bacterium]|nr:MotA/TolQ/ExbB proton channel family protein [Bdellovibrionales bacterium]
MWPLLLCSFIGLAAVIDRLFAHFSSRLNFEIFIERLKKDLLSTNTFSLPNWVKDIKSPHSSLTQVYFEYKDQTEKIRNEALKREGNKLLYSLDKRMSLLSSIVAVSPLLGLLGTVTGLVVAFYSIELKGGAVQPTDLAGGIWEALLTTVVGLSIGIPFLLAHKFFQTRNDKVAANMQELVSELDEIYALKMKALDTSKVKNFEAYGS